jgi:type IV pilus assembly protein PilM
VSVLDFDAFPETPAEQVSLVRFRVKKTIPFDIDSAAVSHHVQPHPASKKVDVIAVTVALEVIARYEALFRSSGFQPGVVTTSALAALNLYRGEGVAVLAKVSGRALTVSVISSNIVKLFRCVALEEASEEEILGVLHPTFAYVEDELGSPVSRLITCGIPQEILGRFKCEIEPLRSRFGTPGPFNAGLLGYLESVEN